MDRRWIFSLVLLTLVYVSVEGLAWLGLWGTDGTVFSPGRLDAERRELLAEHAARLPETGETGAADGAPSWMKAEILHPYQGFVQNPDGAGDPEHHPVSEYGFVDRAPPIHQRAEDRLIVGIFGGSVAEVFGLQGTPALEAGLRSLPELAEHEVVFVRAGLSGYKQPQQLITLTYLLSLGAQFDLVINLDGFNEVALYPTRNALQDWPITSPRTGDCACRSASIRRSNACSVNWCSCATSAPSWPGASRADSRACHPR